MRVEDNNAVLQLPVISRPHSNAVPVYPISQHVNVCIIVAVVKADQLPVWFDRQPPASGKLYDVSHCLIHLIGIRPEQIDIIQIDHHVLVCVLPDSTSFCEVSAFAVVI